MTWGNLNKNRLQKIATSQLERSESQGETEVEN